MACEHWKHLSLVANQKMLAMERERAELGAKMVELPHIGIEERIGNVVTVTQYVRLGAVLAAIEGRGGS